MNRRKLSVMALALCHAWTLGSPAMAVFIGNPYPKAKVRKQEWQRPGERLKRSEGAEIEESNANHNG